jgi:hypothetical protein
MFFDGLGVIQARAKGLLLENDLIPWEKIQSYEWTYDEKQTYTLMLILRGRWPRLLRQAGLDVPTEKQAELARLLAQYAPEGVFEKSS